MENYYTINTNNNNMKNMNISLATRSDLQEKYFDSTKFFKNSSSFNFNERVGGGGGGNSYRSRRSSRWSKLNKVYSQHRTRKSLHNSLSGNYDDSEEKSEEFDFEKEKISTKKPNSSHELLVPYWYVILNS